MLTEVKESIINAYELKTGMSRDKIAKLMDAETWMDANRAVELGFADEILSRESSVKQSAMMYSENVVSRKLWNKMSAKYRPKEQGRTVAALLRSLDLEKKFM